MAGHWAVTGAYCKNEYKLIRKQCMMALWKLMACLAAWEALRWRTYSPCKPASLLLTPFLFSAVWHYCCAFPLLSLPVCLSSCVPSLSCRADYRADCQSVISGRCHKTLMERLRKALSNTSQSPKSSLQWGDSAVSYHMHALQLWATLIIHVKEHKGTLHESAVCRFPARPNF